MVNKFARKKEPELYVSKKDRQERKKLEVKVGKVGMQPTKQEPLQDERLDKLVPLLVEMIGRLLSIGGMLRYRADFISKVKEIMDGKKESPSEG